MRNSAENSVRMKIYDLQIYVIIMSRWLYRWLFHVTRKLYLLAVNSVMHLDSVKSL